MLHLRAVLFFHPRLPQWNASDNSGSLTPANCLMHPVIAVNFGLRANPAWYCNVRTNSRVFVVEPAGVERNHGIERAIADNPLLGRSIRICWRGQARAAASDCPPAPSDKNHTGGVLLMRTTGPWPHRLRGYPLCPSNWAARHLTAAGRPSVAAILRNRSPSSVLVA